LTKVQSLPEDLISCKT